MEKKKNEFLPEKPTKKENEAELRLVKSILSTAIREATSVSYNSKANKAKVEAIRWIRRDDDSLFAFNNVVGYVFDGSVDHGRVRTKLNDMIDTGVEFKFEGIEDDEI